MTTKPRRVNSSARNVLEDDDNETPARPGRKTSSRTAAKSVRNSRTAAKPTRTAAKPEKRSAKNNSRNSRERDTNNSRDRDEDRGSKNFEGLNLTFELARATKNKLVYVELDDDGDMVEEFRGGTLGSPIYYPIKLGGRKPPKQIRVTIEEA